MDIRWHPGCTILRSDDAGRSHRPRILRGTRTPLAASGGTPAATRQDRPAAEPPRLAYHALHQQAATHAGAAPFGYSLPSGCPGINHTVFGAPFVFTCSHAILPADSRTPSARTSSAAALWLPKARLISVCVIPPSLPFSMAWMASAVSSPVASPKMYRTESSQ